MAKSFFNTEKIESDLSENKPNRDETNVIRPTTAS